MLAKCADLKFNENSFGHFRVDTCSHRQMEANSGIFATFIATGPEIGATVHGFVANCCYFYT
jgi:hypothetical protein